MTLYYIENSDSYGDGKRTIYTTRIRQEEWDGLFRQWVAKGKICKLVVKRVL